MIRLLADGVGAGLIAAAMTVAIPMIVFAQTTESDIEHMLATSKPGVADADSTGGDNDLKTGTLVQAVPPTKPAISAEVNVEIQNRFNELRREFLDNRANTIDWWLAVTALVLTFFGIVVAIAGFLGFRRFREIMNEAQEGAKAAAKYAEDAKRHLIEIQKDREMAQEFLKDMNAQTADDNPDEASQAIEDVQNNSETSLMNRAMAAAATFERRGVTEKAIEKWQAIANIAEGSDDDLAAKAWFSIGFVIANQSLEKCISAYSQAIRLKPGYISAYNNRGNAKSRLGQHEAAILDYNECIYLNPNHLLVYNNRGNAKFALHQHEAAIPDYDKCISLNPDFPPVYYNRGLLWLARKEWDKAKSDLDDAKNRGLDIIATFRSEYDSVADFEKQYSVNVPEGIKAILEP